MNYRLVVAAEHAGKRTIVEVPADHDVHDAVDAAAVCLEGVGFCRATILEGFADYVEEHQ